MTGFININKEEGVSSAREVAVVKRLTGMPCGHMGTLDPMAGGVLPVGIGNACRLFDYFLSKKKIYIATFKFGVSYDTLDTTGRLLTDGGYVPAAEEVDGVLPSLVGEVMQVPPAFSAKHVGGKRSYALARAGEEVTLPPKRVEIFSVERVGSPARDEFSFRIECGGGTYVRSICRDMAQKLGTTAAMSALVREQSGAFHIKNSVKSRDLSAENISAYIIPTDSVLPFECAQVGGEAQKKLLNGMSVSSSLADGTYKIYLEDGQFYGLGVVADCRLKVKTKLC